MRRGGGGGGLDRSCGCGGVAACDRAVHGGGQWRPAPIRAPDGRAWRVSRFLRRDLAVRRRNQDDRGCGGGLRRARPVPCRLRVERRAARIPAGTHPRTRSRPRRRRRAGQLHVPGRRLAGGRGRQADQGCAVSAFAGRPRLRARLRPRGGCGAASGELLARR